ncbi:hypothetical protein RJ640_005859 [Escallonia rubra]|uniref:Ty3 transposon capsid-like protein domain-containing protein n=1 Tax=Escallonia rubra TaxID=112253 RepID=A0AA88S0K3_9ASTE|nr:hypothetical protein RJ640_005859 [Escallonia rubra]
MPRSSKSSLLETDSLGLLDGLERRFETPNNQLRLGPAKVTKRLFPPINNQNSLISFGNPHNQNFNNSMPKTPKLTFPRFNGDNPRGRVKRCEQYFEFCPIPEEFKVTYASVHFEDQVEYWYSTYIKPLGKVTWTKFVHDMYARFSNVSRDSVIAEFNQLKQTTSVSEYYNHFEELRAQVVEEFGSMDEGYFIKSFIGGLKPEIRSRVEQFKVMTLTKAIHIARKEEVEIANLFPHAKAHQTSSSNPSLQ